MNNSKLQTPNPEFLTLIRVRNPFHPADREIARLPHEGLTLAELRAREVPASVPVVSSVNGAVVPKEQLSLCRPLPGDCVVFFPEVAGGGDDKSVLRIAAMITLTVLIPQATPLWAKLAIISAGGMLVNALLPPPKPDIPVPQDPDASQSYAWSPQTVQQQGVPVPKFYGVNKAYGNIIAAHIESDGRDQTANALISLGMGPLRRIYDFTLMDQPIASYQGVTVDTRPGTVNAADQNVLPNFNKTKIEFPLSVKITKDMDPEYVHTTAGDAFDGLEVEVAFPYGLWHINARGEVDAHSVNLEVAVRRQGDTNWIHLARSSAEVLTSAGGYWSLGYWVRYFNILSGESWPVWAEEIQGSADPYAHTEGETVYGGDDGIGNRTWRWIGDPIHLATALYDYEPVTAAETAAFRKVWRVDGLARGRYEVRVRNLTDDQTSTSYGDDVWFVMVREVIAEAFTYPRTALVGLRALATDQLSGGLRFACKTDGSYVRVWTGSAWVYQASNNPAWVCWDILTQPVIDAKWSPALWPGYDYFDAEGRYSLKTLRYDGKDPAELDLAAFKAWADWCDELVPDGEGGTEKRITFNGAFDYAGNMWAAAMQVCQVGRAVLVQYGTIFTVAVDKAASPVQLFSVGNITAGSFREMFLPLTDRSSELNIDFINAEKDHARDTFSVPLNLDDDTLPPNPAQMQLFGVTRPSEAWRAGLYRLYSNRYLTRSCEFEADVDAIACTIGDVVNVQHDIPQWGLGGRVVSADANTVTLDREVVIEAGKSYSVMVRLANDTLVTKAVSTGAGTHTTLAVSTPFSSVPAQYDLYAFGETDKVVKPFRVIGLTRSSELRRVVHCIEYNETIQNVDTGQPVLPTPNYSSLNNLPPVTGIVLDELLIKRRDGTLDDVIDVSFTRPVEGPFDHAEIWHNSGGGWVFSGTAFNFHRIYGVTVGKTYTIAVVTVNTLGRKQQIQNAPKEQLYTLGKLDKPSNVTNFKATQNGQIITFTWDHIPDGDLKGYRIVQGSAWEGARQIVDGEASNRYEWRAELNGTYRFLIKAVDTSGLESATAASFDITLRGIDENLNVVISQDEITKPGGPDGVKTNFVFVDASPDFMTMPHMLTDTDVSGLTDQSADLTGYEGDITLSAEYVSLAIDTTKTGNTWTRILDALTATDPGATDQSYPSRTDQTYPADKDTAVTMPVDRHIYVSYSDNGADWSAWAEYFGAVQEGYRYIKVKYALAISSQTGVIKLTSLLLSLDVPDVEFVIENFAVSAGTGNDVSFSTYSMQFYAAPTVTATVIGGTVNKVPVVSSKSATGFHIDMRDKTDAAVAGTVDITVKGY